MCESNNIVENKELLEQSISKCLSGDICVKCNQLNVSVPFCQGSFCKNCFQVYVIHKFRAAIGRTKLIKNGEEVLVAFSGGANSAALLHLIQHGKSERAHRKLRFVPAVLYVDDCGALELSTHERMEKRYDVLKLLIAAGFPAYVSCLEQALMLTRSEDVSETIFSKVTSLNTSFALNEYTDELKVAVSNLSSLTSMEDYIRQLRWQLIVAVARKLGITKVLTAENCTKLAVQVLSSVAQGRGSQISLSAGFSDSRNSDVMIIRPLRDLSSSDLAVYNKLSDVKSVFIPGVTKIPSALSIESLTETFVLNLQKDFPSTINNIKRTIEKLDHADLQLPKCGFCQSPLDIQMEPSSACSALKFSQMLSHQDFSHCTESFKEVQNQAFCYGCCLTVKNYKEESSTLPVLIRKTLPVPSATFK